MLPSLQKLLKKLDRTPQDVVGLDFGTTGLKCVRLKKTPAGVVLLAADILPPLVFPDDPTAADPKPLTLARHLMAPYAALALPTDKAIIKVLSFPGEFSPAMEEQIVPHMGLENAANFRVNYKLLVNGHPRSESRLLAVAYSASQAARAPRILPSGPPAPFSLEVSGLSTLTAFVDKIEKKRLSETVGHLEIGEKSSVFALFTKGVPVLIRKFEFGVETVMNQVRQGLGVTAQVAYDIVASGSIDISHWVSEGAQPFIKQLLVSRDFVERRENCRIRQFFLSGGGGAFAPLRKEIEQAFDLEFLLWNPFDELITTSTPLGEAVTGQESRMTGAVGVALAAMEVP